MKNRRGQFLENKNKLPDNMASLKAQKECVASRLRCFMEGSLTSVEEIFYSKRKQWTHTEEEEYFVT